MLTIPATASMIFGPGNGDNSVTLVKYVSDPIECRHFNLVMMTRMGLFEI